MWVARAYVLSNSALLSNRSVAYGLGLGYKFGYADGTSVCEFCVNAQLLFLCLPRDGGWIGGCGPGLICFPELFVCAQCGAYTYVYSKCVLGVCLVCKVTRHSKGCVSAQTQVC